MCRLSTAIDLAPSVGISLLWRMMQIMDQTLREQVRDSFKSSTRDAAADYDKATRAEYVCLKLAGLRDAPVRLALFTQNR